MSPDGDIFWLAPANDPLRFPVLLLIKVLTLGHHNLIVQRSVQSCLVARIFVLLADVTAGLGCESGVVNDTNQEINWAATDELFLSCLVGEATSRRRTGVALLEVVRHQKKDRETWTNHRGNEANTSETTNNEAGTINDARFPGSQES